MVEQLRILILEDQPSDAELMVHELRVAGFAPIWRRVESRTEFLAALEETYDCILTDYKLPQFDALRALKLLKQKGSKVPFIVVTGTLGDEAAAECIKAGATDYLLKDRLARLGQAVRGAIESARLRAAELAAESALRASESRYRELAESIADVFFAIDHDLCYTYWNRASEQLVGLSAAEAVGKRLQDILPPNAETRAMVEFYQMVLRSGKPQMKETHYHVGDKVLYLETSAYPSASGLSVFARDVTEHKRIEQQLVQAQKMESIGRLAGGIAHDFNNLLTVIGLNAEMALRSLREADPMRRELEEVCRAGERAARLTRQLLAFSRRQVLEMRAVDLNEVLEGLGRMIQRVIGEDITLEIKPGKGVGPIKADPGQIEQVVLNLVVNARDAMPTGGRLSIETANVMLDGAYFTPDARAVKGEYVMLTISDTGTGMSDEVKAHLFEPFFTTKEQGKGTGLGLAMVYGIVRQHQGFIGVYSELGHGTTLRVYLPQVRETPTPVAARSVNGALSRGSEMVLVVEDETAVRRITVRVLKALGYNVLEAANGEQALGLARLYGDKIALLLTDIVMPVMGGRALAEHLTQEYPLLPVLFLSGYTDDVVTHQQLLERGAAFLPKPFTPDILAHKVREMLDARG